MKKKEKEKKKKKKKKVRRVCPFSLLFSQVLTKQTKTCQSLPRTTVSSSSQVWVRASRRASHTEGDQQIPMIT